MVSVIIGTLILVGGIAAGATYLAINNQPVSHKPTPPTDSTPSPSPEIPPQPSVPIIPPQPPTPVPPPVTPPAPTPTPTPTLSKVVISFQGANQFEESQTINLVAVSTPSDLRDIRYN